MKEYRETAPCASCPVEIFLVPLVRQHYRCGAGWMCIRTEEPVSLEGGERCCASQADARTHLAPFECLASGVRTK